MADQTGDIKSDSKKKILILAANPKNTERLRFDEEVSKIKERLRISRYRDRFEIHSELAINYDSLRIALLENEPHIVHFIGHGSENGIVLEEKLGFAEVISTKKLSGLFKLFSKHVECVILNACYSAAQADAINKYIPYVIGMNKEVGDEASIVFAKGFYDGIGAGRPVKEAYEFGCNAVVDNPEPIDPFLKEKEGQEKLWTPPGISENKETVYSTQDSEKKEASDGGYDGKETDTITSKSTSKINEVGLQIHVGPKDKRKSMYINIFLTLGIISVLISFYPLIHKPASQSGTSGKTGPVVKAENNLSLSNQKNPVTQVEQKVNEIDKSREEFSIESKQSDSPKPGMPKTSPAHPLPNGNLLKEIKEKGLLEKLREASRFCEAGNSPGENQALTLYREVVEQLSPGVRQASTRLKEADTDYRNKNYTHALRKYNALFDKVIDESLNPGEPLTPSPINIAYLKPADYPGHLKVDYNQNRVSLTSPDGNEPGSWIKFKNDSIDWKEYDRIGLKVDYDENAEFDRSAMLKLQLNGTILSPIEGKVKQLGTNPDDRYLIQDRGRFYYPFKSSTLGEDNEIIITLNKGKWQNVYIELALTKNEAK